MLWDLLALWFPTRLRVWHLCFFLPFLAWSAWDDYHDVVRESGDLAWLAAAPTLVLLAVWLVALVGTLRLHARAEALAGGAAPRPPALLPRARLVRGPRASAPSVVPLAGSPPRVPEHRSPGTDPELLR